MSLEDVLQQGRQMVKELHHLEDRLFRQVVLLSLIVDKDPSERNRLEAESARARLLEVRAQLDADRAGGSR